MRRPPHLPRRQEGVVLLVAVIVLVAMTLAALGLVRSVDTGNMVAGNLAFKQGATAAGDIGTQAAVAWLSARIDGEEVNQDQPGQGYYATSQDNLDMTGTANDAGRALVDWEGNNCAGREFSACVRPSAAIAAAGGNQVRYVIHRLCSSAGSPNDAGNTCANYLASSSASPKRGELKYGDDKRFEPPPAEYYRITSRIAGPRNTVSYVETLVHF